MDGKKDLVPDWATALDALRHNGQDSLADEIDNALRAGHKIQAIKLLKASGLLREAPQPP